MEGGEAVTFRQFKKWCSQREAEGHWDYDEAKFCLAILSVMKQVPFWKRRRAWKKIKNAVTTIAGCPDVLRTVAITGEWKCKID